MAFDITVRALSADSGFVSEYFGVNYDQKAFCIGANRCTSGRMW